MTDNPKTDTRNAKSSRSAAAWALVGRAYLVAILFVGIFLGLLMHGSKVSASLSAPVWALLVAVVLTLPVLAPWLMNSILPRVSSLKLSEFEVAFRQAETQSAPIALATQALAAGLGDDPVLSEYTGRMTSLSSSIFDALKTVQASNHEVLTVDFVTRWVAPNLYFLALMAAQKTRIRQIAFVDSRGSPDRFVCSSSPEEILTALASHYPVLSEAAKAARFDQDPRSLEQQAGAEFFNQLGVLYNRVGTANSERVLPLSPETLLWLLGPAAHQNTVAWSDQPNERQYRAVLASESQFVAALDGRQLLFLINRDRVALTVARIVERGT